MTLLPTDLLLATPVALDTETSGLFIDGDHEKAPPARVAVVSLAWYETCDACWGTGVDPEDSRVTQPCPACDGGGDVLVSLALPFDQGRVAGKPGRFNKLTGTYDELPNPEPCPWNLPVDAWQELLAWLVGRPLVMQHEKFDQHIMSAGLRGKVCHGDDGPHPEGCRGGGVDLTAQTVYDTMLAQGVLAPLQSSALKTTAQRLWGYDEGDESRLVKAALKKNGVGLTWRYDLLPWDVIGPYAAKDAELTIRIFRHHQQLIEVGAVDSDQLNVIEREFALSKVLFQLETRGVGFDAPGCKAEADKIRVAMEQLRVTFPFDPSKPTQAKKFYFGTDTAEGQLGLIPQKTTEKTQQPQLDAAVLRELAKQGQPHATDLQEYAHLSSAVSKWYEGWPARTGQDGRLRTNYRQGRIESDRPGNKDGGAISGRLSVERVQLQAIPHAHRIPKGVRGVRDFFVAKPGHVLWELDLGQAEVRIATWASRCHPMAAVLAAGNDVHGSTATAVFGVQPGDDSWDEMRAVAKRLTFAMLYGAGVRTTREQILFFTGIDYSEAKTRAMIDTYRSRFPQFVRAAREAQRKADKGMGGPGFVRLAGGRRRYFGWGERTHKAFNAVIQGGQAEILKEWILATERQFPGVLLLTIHDSLVIEVPDTEQDHYVHGIRDLGIKIFESYFSTPELPIAFTVDAKRWGT